MRITIVTGPWLPVPAVQGGSVPRMWHGLAEEFAKRRHDVLVMSRTFSGQPKSELRNGVGYRRVGGFAQGRSTYLDLAKDFVYAAQVLSQLPPADVLVLNDFWLPILATWSSPSTGRIVVSANRFPKGQYRFYRRVGRVIAASKAIEKAIVAQTPAVASLVRCIPNPFDTSRFVPPSDDRTNRLSRKILYAGRVHPEKGLTTLIAAFGQIAPQHSATSLNIIGPVQPKQGGGGERYLEKLKQLADDLPITFAPPEFDVSKLAVTYQSADLFCYPSTAEKGEALPVAPLEAMSTALPPIVSGLECFRDVIVDQENGFYFDHKSRDPVAALAQKIDEALHNWPRTLEIGQRARQSVQRFAFDRVAEQFLTEFDQLLGAE